MSSFMRSVMAAAAAAGMLGAVAVGVAPAGAATTAGHSVGGVYIGAFAGSSAPTFEVILEDDHEAVVSFEGLPLDSGTWGYTEATDHVWVVVSGVPVGTCHLSGLKVPDGISTPSDPGTITCANHFGEDHAKWYGVVAT